jgi:hypothetical protein
MAAMTSSFVGAAVKVAAVKISKARSRRERRGARARAVVPVVRAATLHAEQLRFLLCG